MTRLPILSLHDVSRSFAAGSGRSLEILRSVSLSIYAGEVVAIRGRSGSGKSTLLNLMGLLDAPTGGRVEVHGRDCTELGDAARAALRGTAIGFVFQQFHLLRGRTAAQNVAEPLLFGSREERRRRHARAAELLESVGLRDRCGAMPEVLSGGEQQRVAIARALARRPAVVLADEPTGSLDLATGAAVMERLLETTRREAAALVIVTHDPAIAALADRTLLLDAGGLRDNAQ